LKSNTARAILTIEAISILDRAGRWATALTSVPMSAGKCCARPLSGGRCFRFGSTATVDDQAAQIQEHTKCTHLD